MRGPLFQQGNPTQGARSPIDLGDGSRKTGAMRETPDLDMRKQTAQAWFEQLRDQILDAFEALDASAPADLFPGEAGRFERKPWVRDAGGGGVMSMMYGRLFEKVGVHTSAVHGTLSPELAASMPGGADNPAFFATGVSLIAHMRSPKVPAVHMNTRFICTGQSWFGGGADLTPLLNYQRQSQFPDAVLFHEALQAACDRHNSDWYSKYKAWCDEYFFLPHRQESRGIGGIFFDHHNSGDFDADFAFTRDVGVSFLDVYSKIVRTRMTEAWTADERDEQLVRRGRYVEFNLLYDRGTMFGLKTGGNVEFILSSMPPEVRWT